MNIFENLENLNVSEECFEEIMGLVEEVINEVSVGMWRQAAKNSLEDRKKDAKEKDEVADNIMWKNAQMKRESKKAEQKEEEACSNAFDSKQRAKHAEEVSLLSDSKIRASRVKRAAQNSREGRRQEAINFNKKLRDAHNKGIISVYGKVPNPRYDRAKYLGDDFRKGDWSY